MSKREFMRIQFQIFIYFCGLIFVCGCAPQSFQSVTSASSEPSVSGLVGTFTCSDLPITVTSKPTSCSEFDKLNYVGSQIRVASLENKQISFTCMSCVGGGSSASPFFKQPTIGCTASYSDGQIAFGAQYTTTSNDLAVYNPELLFSSNGQCGGPSFWGGNPPGSDTQSYPTCIQVDESQCFR